MSLDRDPLSRRESKTASWGRAVHRNQADRLSYALSEKQMFIESVYYQNGSSFLSPKPLTEPMKRLVIDPFDDCIDKDSLHILPGFTGRLLPSLDEWQQQRSPDISYGNFKAILAKERDLDKNLRNVFLQQFLIRAAEQHYQSVSIRDYHDPMEEYINISAKYATGNLNEEQQKYAEEISIRLKKVRYLANQMKRFGIDKIINHYEKIRDIKAAVFPKDIDIVINSTIIEYPRISILLKNSPLETANAVGLDELSRDIFFAVREKRLELRIQAEKQDQIKSTFSQEDLSKDLSKQFKVAFENLISLIPENDRHFFDKSPYYVLKLAMALRKILPVANTEVLAQIWWQLRLGGSRAKDIVNHVKKELPGFVKKQKLERYTRHLADNFLGSEASSFEFQNIVKIEDQATPNKIIFQIVKNLIRNHIPKDQKDIRLTFLDRDKRFLKISVPYREGILDSEIETNIGIALNRNRQWRDIPLNDERERAKLSYLGHNSLKRKRDKIYRAVYQGFGVNQKTNEDYDGDYLVQIGSIYDDSRDPRSLFAVDSHKASIQLKFKEAGKVIVTTRYNHQYFDGKPAKSHTESLISEIDKPETKASSLMILPEEQNTQINFLKDSLEQPEELELPLVESRADYDDDHEYINVPLENNIFLTSTDLRCLAIARANGIQYFQQLVAGEKQNDSYFVRNPNANNIQPVIVAPVTLKKQNRLRWVQSHRESTKRAKKSISDVALFAAIAGTREAPLTYAGRILNPTLINMLTHSQGMISPLMEYANFTTAFSDAYRPAEINLVKPIPSLGVIGMSIDKRAKSHYTVRLLPSQAQQKLREAVEKLFIPNLSKQQKTIVLTKFTKIIQAWDKLVCGDGNQNQITLEEYTRLRNNIVNNLVKQGLIDLNKLRVKSKTIQMYLNDTLKEAAIDILNPIKITRAIREILTVVQN